MVADPLWWKDAAHDHGANEREQRLGRKGRLHALLFVLLKA